MKQFFLYIFLAFLLINCKKEEGRFIAEKSYYQVVINLNWNSADFPTDYPSNPHFSRVIGWNHNVSSTLFSEGSDATLGVQKMAEEGKVTPLDSEMLAKISNYEGSQLFIGENLASGVGIILIDSVEITKDFPLLSFVSMIAPSPDWYIGVFGVNLYENNQFLEGKTVDLDVFDAGTDSGITFESNDSITSPQQPISLLVDAPLGNGISINKKIGTVTFTKQLEL